MSDWATLASAVAAIAAAILAGLALIANNRSAEAARRSANAAELAVQMATEVRWTVARIGESSTVRLTNQGRQSAYLVKVEADDLIGRPPEWDHIAGNEAVDFMQATMFGKRKDGTEKSFTMTVTWHLQPDSSDELRTWRHPLP